VKDNVGKRRVGDPVMLDYQDIVCSDILEKRVDARTVDELVCILNRVALNKGERSDFLPLIRHERNLLYHFSICDPAFVHTFPKITGNVDELMQLNDIAASKQVATAAIDPCVMVVKIDYPPVDDPYRLK
jgi:hypothetical protein